MAERTIERKVAIIGAGASGLSAAHRFSQFDMGGDVVVLEAEERIGGRIHTISKNGGVIELGAQWIHGKIGNPLYEFAVDRMIPLSPIANRDGEGVFVRNDGQIMPEDLRIETEMKLEEIHEDINKFAKEEFRGKAPNSVGHFFTDEFHKWMKLKAMEGESEEALSWRKQFLDWWIRWEECDAGCDSLFDQSAISWGQYVDYDDDTSFANGYGTFLEKLTQEISDETLILKNHLVQNIDWSLSEENNGKVVIKSGNNLEIRCQFVIITISLGYLKRHNSTLFTPKLPNMKVKVIEDSFEFGTIDRIKLDFETPFWNPDNPGFHILWNNEGLEQKWGDKLTRNNWLRHVVGFDGILAQPNMLMAWISGEPARFMETLSDEEIGEDLCSLLGMVTQKTIPRLRSINVTRWFSNPYQLGAYSYRSPRTDKQEFDISDLSLPLRKSHLQADSEDLKARDEKGSETADPPLVLFAGEATDPGCYGTVHGAMQAGIREAERIVDLIA